MGLGCPYILKKGLGVANSQTAFAVSLRCVLGCAWLWVHQQKTAQPTLRLGGGGLFARVKRQLWGCFVRGNRLFTAKRFALYNLVLTQEEQKDYGSN